MTELKPCPFCGSTPRTNHPPMRNKVFCNTCGAETATVEDWNCRPDTEADTLRAEVARLREAWMYLDAASCHATYTINSILTGIGEADSLDDLHAYLTNAIASARLARFAHGEPDAAEGE